MIRIRKITNLSLMFQRPLGLKRAKGRVDWEDLGFQWLEELR